MLDPSPRKPRPFPLAGTRLTGPFFTLTKRLCPLEKGLASWNYIREKQISPIPLVSVSYYMNRITLKYTQHYFVSLNGRAIDEEKSFGI